MIKEVNYKEWNYQEMGFESQEELKESYDRVMEEMKNPKNHIERAVENRNDLQAQLEANDGVLDTQKLREDVRKSNLDITVHNRILYERERAKQRAEQEEMQELFKDTAESIRAENEAKAEKEMKKAREKAEAELQKDIHSKHGVKTDKEKSLDDAYSSMLEGLK